MPQGMHYSDFLFSQGKPLRGGENKEAEAAKPTGKPKPKVDPRIYVDLKHALEKRDRAAYKEAHRRAHRKKGDAGDDPEGRRGQQDSVNVDHEIKRIIKPVVDQDPDGAAEFLDSAFPSEEYRNAEAFGIIRVRSEDEVWEKCVKMNVHVLQTAIYHVDELGRQGWPVNQCEAHDFSWEDLAN